MFSSLNNICLNASCHSGARASACQTVKGRTADLSQHYTTWEGLGRSEVFSVVDWMIK